MCPALFFRSAAALMFLFLPVRFVERVAACTVRKLVRWRVCWSAAPLQAALSSATHVTRKTARSFIEKFGKSYPYVNTVKIAHYSVVAI